MKIDDIEKKIKELNKLKKLLRIPVVDDDSIEELVFKKYLELENVTKVAEYINGVGHRIRNRKYIANDISAIITSKEIRLKNRDLKETVIKLFKAHKRGRRQSNW
jgi:hypothetical protein